MTVVGSWARRAARLLAGCVLGLALCAGGAAVAQDGGEGGSVSGNGPTGDGTALVIGGGVPFGLYFPLGGSICDLMRADGVSGCSVAPIADSAEAIAALKTARVDLALVQSDWLAHAVEGSSRFSATGPAEWLRAVASLHGEGLVVLVRSDDGFEEPGDLEGARLSRGPAESYRALLSYALLSAAGLGTDDLAQIGEEDVRGGLAKLCRGETDAVAAVTAMPASIAASAPAGCSVSYLPIPAEVAEDASAAMPGVEPLALAVDGGTGREGARRLSSFGLTAVLTATADADPALVERATRVLVKGAASLAAHHPALSTIASARLGGARRFAPLHPAAEAVLGSR